VTAVHGTGSRAAERARPERTRVLPFLSPAWLAELDLAFRHLPAEPRSCVRLGLTLSDPPPGTVPGLVLVCDLASGAVRVDGGTDPAAGDPHLRLGYRDAARLLLGSALDRVRVFESMDTVLVGNFTALFFLDRRLQQDGDGRLGRLRRLAGGLPADLGPIGWPEPPGPATGSTPEVESEVEQAAVAGAAEALPATLAALRAELGRSTPGAQLYVSRGGQVLADIGLGEARPGVPFSRRSAPLWYCCGKPLLSLAVGQLWERGLLDPFAPVCRYLPDFTGDRREELTLLQILTHTGPVPTGLDPLHGCLFGPAEPRRRLVRTLRVPPEGVAGQHVNYSQWWSWLLLGDVIEAVDGRPYDRYLVEEILTPLGIAGSTTVRLSEPEFRRRGDTLPVFYISAAGRPAQPTLWFASQAATTCMLPGVNTRGPMADLGRFFELLLAGGRVPGGPRIAAPTTVAAITARHRTGIYDAYGNADWGLGFRLECRQIGPELTSFSRHSSPRAYGHDGLWTATAFADPDADLVVALHLNGKTRQSQHRDRLGRICDAVYADLGYA
jgi:CubicO group peptidase (beta-lactamase class C family)